jgi:hypothetical protein
MTPNMKFIAAVLGVTATAGVAVVGTGAADPGGFSLTDVPSANTRSDGYAPANRWSPELTPVVVAQGATRVENPSALTSFYGYDNDVLNAAGDPQMVPTPTKADEATKTEPDKNTYLMFRRGLTGADASYDYGRHFLFQGHENGAGGAGYITRVNLDADAAHRVTLLATKDTDGNPITTIDGSTWDPFAQRLIFTTEGSSKPTYAATPGYPSTVTDISGSVGRGGYEGVQNDSAGDLYLVEDIGGSKKAGTAAKIPNSFVYRFIPASPDNLSQGKLQALQVLNEAGAAPITQATQTAIDAPDQVALNTYGKSFKTRWVTVHDTAVDGTTPFNANDAAKAHDATPFKRPENGVFRPGTKFREFFFTATGDTNNTSPEWSSAGGAGALFKLSQSAPTADTGTLTLFYKSDTAHAGLDNIQFFSKDVVGAVEDAGDTLHGQRNALDSGYAFDARTDYSDASQQPVRFFAEGRDASATIDAANGGFGHNDGDNEITGLAISDGDPTPAGILGAKNPNLRDPQWRAFVTQQHGDNFTYELLFDARRGDD